MDYREAIEQLKQLLNKPYNISLVKLEVIIGNLSVTDNISPEGAVTHLYTRVDNYDFIKDEVRGKRNGICK